MRQESRYRFPAHSCSGRIGKALADVALKREKLVVQFVVHVVRDRRVVQNVVAVCVIVELVYEPLH